MYKHILLISVIIATLAGSVFARSDGNKTLKTTAAASDTTKTAAAKPETVDIAKLAPDDAKTLANIADQIEKMSPNIKAAQDQAEKAQAQLQQAQLFLSQYNGALTSQVALFYKLCATLKLDPEQYQLTKDGKGLAKKAEPKPDSAK